MAWYLALIEACQWKSKIPSSGGYPIVYLSHERLSFKSQLVIEASLTSNDELNAIKKN